jgi:hypothetical protein
MKTARHNMLCRAVFWFYGNQKGKIEQLFQKAVFHGKIWILGRFCAVCVAKKALQFQLDLHILKLRGWGKVSSNSTKWGKIPS